MKVYFFCLLVFVSLVSGCFGGNVRYESKDIEREVKKKKIKVSFLDGGDFDLKYRSYFQDRVRSYFSIGTETVIIEGDDYDFFVRVKVSNFLYILDAKGETYTIRLDFLVLVDVISFDGVYLLSNDTFSYTFVTNLPFEVFYRPFEKDLFLQNVFYKFFDDSALNLVYFASTGWKGDYGYYTIKDGLIQRIIGVSTNETPTKRTNKRNIPVVGGE